jgi:hypothetical protein
MLKLNYFFEGLLWFLLDTEISNINLPFTGDKFSLKLFLRRRLSFSVFLLQVLSGEMDLAEISFFR